MLFAVSNSAFSTNSMSESLVGAGDWISAPLMSLTTEFIKMFSCSCCTCCCVVVKPEAKICVSTFFLLTKGSVIYFLLRIFAMPHQNDWVR